MASRILCLNLIPDFVRTCTGLYTNATLFMMMHIDKSIFLSLANDLLTLETALLTGFEESHKDKCSCSGICLAESVRILLSCFYLNWRILYIDKTYIYGKF